jgi:hypothetical protein
MQDHLRCGARPADEAGEAQRALRGIMFPAPHLLVPTPCLLSGTPSRWGNLPEHIDVARSMTLVRVQKLWQWRKKRVSLVASEGWPSSVLHLQNTQASQGFDEDHTPWIEQVMVHASHTCACKAQTQVMDMCAALALANNLYIDTCQLGCTNAQVGSKPKVYIFHNFLTNAERTHMIRVAAPQVCTGSCYLSSITCQEQQLRCIYLQQLGAVT